MCRDAGIGVIPWSPLARGFLGRSHAHALDKQSHPRQKRQYSGHAIRRRRCGNSAPRRGDGQKHGKNNAQIATAWLLAKGVTAPIIGASKMSHLEDAIAAADIKLTAEEVAYLDAPYKPKAVAGNLR